MVPRNRWFWLCFRAPVKQRSAEGGGSSTPWGSVLTPGVSVLVALWAGCRGMEEILIVGGEPRGHG